MKLTIPRSDLLQPLQDICGVVERRQTLPILSNVLLVAEETTLRLTATDLEVQLVAKTAATVITPGSITLPARKLFDICKSLPEGNVDISLNKDRVTVKSGKSRFTLATLPVTDFPDIERPDGQIEFRLKQRVLKELFDQTQFAMAHQDVRYYLNGLLFEMSDGNVRAVATDGHRLALCESEIELSLEELRQVIIPRKGVVELSRLLEVIDELVTVRVGKSHLQVSFGDIEFISKLVDGRFPDYNRVIPKKGENILMSDRALLCESLSRAAILSNEKYRGVRIQLGDQKLKITANNPEQEEAEEELDVDYGGDHFEIGFNVRYLIDALAAVKQDKARISFSDANSSCVIEGMSDSNSRFVVMPMRL